MATKSDNKKGNPYHDEATGEFTSADDSGSGSGSKNEPNSTPPELEQTTSTPPNSSPIPTPTKTLKLKFKGNVESARENLRQSKQVSSIPFLQSAKDIEEHLEDYFTKEVIDNIDSKFGKFKYNYKFYNLRTDPDQRCGVNIFAACIGKKRWANNYLKIIDKSEYDKLLINPNYQPLYRGLCGDDTMFETIANSYSSKENEMIYGSVGGTCYGIAVYASTRRGEAISYADNNEKHVMHLVLDKNARTMNYNKLLNIRNELNRNKGAIVQKVENLFLNHGIEPSRAKTMANSFGITMNDEGFVAMLCGVEWYNDNDSYHMIENLGAMFRLLK